MSNNLYDIPIDSRGTMAATLGEWFEDEEEVIEAITEWSNRRVAKAVLDGQINELSRCHPDDGYEYEDGSVITISQRIAALQNQRNALDKKEDL